VTETLSPSGSSSDPPAGSGFQIIACDGGARCGRIATAHGDIDTPAFMCVATFGAVRGVSPGELEALGAQVLLANTYHLHERPGEEIIRAQGGLQGFTGWRGPWLTDSGGFQVTSLSHRVKIAEEGITFSSPVDGRRRLLTPESAIAIQEALGSDIAMVLDECRPPPPGAAGTAASVPAERELEAAMERTLRWAERSRTARRCGDQAVFGIVQGGVSEALRRRSARATASMGFDGYAHGGLGLGEGRSQRADLVAAVHDELPGAAPRYLMGLGKPVDLVDGVAGGVDLFDCVVPSRNARHGLLYTRAGHLRLRNARFKNDPRPPEPGCDCPTCQRHSRAYLRHLLKIDEPLGARLATLHNLRFYLRVLAEARRAVVEGRFESYRRQVAATADATAD
jgi:queuine tRNA-ribosyltransferase